MACYQSGSVERAGYLQSSQRRVSVLFFMDISTIKEKTHKGFIDPDLFCDSNVTIFKIRILSNGNYVIWYLKIIPTNQMFP